MTPLEIGYVGIAILIVLLFSGVHIGVAMGLVGFLGMSFISGWPAGLAILKTVPFTTFANYGMSVVPLFILMGTFCFYSGISKDLYDSVHKWLGQMRGGLAMATVGCLRGICRAQRIESGNRRHHGDSVASGNEAAQIRPHACRGLYRRWW